MSEHLIDYVLCKLTCESCQKTFGDYGMDDYTVAEKAKKLGWRVTRNGNVLCGNCKR